MSTETGSSLAKFSLIYGVAHAIPAGFGLLLITICALYLSPSELGIIGLAEAAAIIIAHISIMGLPAGLRRLFFSVEDQKQRAILISTILRGGILFALSATALSLIFGPILLGAVPTHFPDFFPYFAYAIIYQIWYQFLEYRLVLYQVRGRAKLYAKLQFLVGFAIFCSVILQVVYLNKGAEGFLLGRVVAVGIVMVFVLYSLRKELLPAWCGKTFLHTLAFSVPLLPHVLSMTLVNFADRFILEIYTTTDEVGQYTLAYTLGMAMYLVTVAFSLAWGPFFFKSLEKKQENTERIAQLAGKAVALAFCIAILGVVISKDFVILAFRDEYHSIATIVPLVISGYLLFFLYSLFSYGVFQSKKTVLLVPVTAITALINIVLNVWLIPEYGMKGAAWATVAAFAFQAFAIYLIAKREFPLPYPMIKVGVFLVLFCFVLFQTQSDMVSGILKYWSGIAAMLAILFIGFSDYFLKQREPSVKA